MKCSEQWLFKIKGKVKEAVSVLGSHKNCEAPNVVGNDNHLPLSRDRLCCRENPRVCCKGFALRVLSGEHFQGAVHFITIKSFTCHIKDVIKPVSDASQRTLCEDDLIKLKVFYKGKVLLVVAGMS